MMELPVPVKVTVMPLPADLLFVRLTVTVIVDVAIPFAITIVGLAVAVDFDPLRLATAHAGGAKNMAATTNRRNSTKRFEAGFKAGSRSFFPQFMMPVIFRLL
jgi:hypothetical protein